MLPEYVKFYHDKLPDWMRPMYEAIYWAVRNQEEYVTIDDPERKLTSQQVGYLQKCIYYDCPSFYYWHYNKWWFQALNGGKRRRIKLFYWYTPEQRQQFDAQINAGIQEFLRLYIKDDMTQFEREVAIHDYLVSTVTYDHKALAVNDDPTNPKHHDEIYSILGALLKKKAVCAGISSAFKLLCDASQVKCFVVVGGSRREGSTTGHAWNMVKLDGKTYHVDATWDLRDAGDIRMCYDNLNLDDGLIRMDHDWDNDIYPACDSVEYNIYHRGRYFVTRLDRVSKYVEKHLKAGERYLAFKFANNDLPPTEDIVAEMRKGMRAALSGSYSFKYRVSRELHNIYLQVQQG